MPPLDAAAVTEALAGLPGWDREGDEIVKTFERASFADAIAFVVHIGFFAELADHHPDLDIRWRKVRVALTTHDAGGLTEKDVALARNIEGIAEAMPLVVVLVIAFGLLVFMWYGIAREKGPGPADVALAYERAWDELDFALLYDLSGEELHDGLRKDRFIGAKQAAYATAAAPSRIGADVTVETSVTGNQTSLVVTRVEAHGDAVRNNVMLERRSNGWVVVAYSLRTDDEQTRSS